MQCVRLYIYLVKSHPLRFQNRTNWRLKTVCIPNHADFYPHLALGELLFWTLAEMLRMSRTQLLEIYIWESSILSSQVLSALFI